MSELKKCSRCHSVQLIKYFGETRKGKPFKTCETCRGKSKVCKNKKDEETHEEILRLLKTIKQEKRIEIFDPDTMEYF